MSTGMFPAWHYSIANYLPQILQPQAAITAATNLFCLLLFPIECQKTRHIRPPYASQHHQMTIFTFLLVNRQLLFESETNDRRSSPLAHHHVGRKAKSGSLTNARPRRAGGELKRPSSNGPAGFQRISH